MPSYTVNKKTLSDLIPISWKYSPMPDVGIAQELNTVPDGLSYYSTEFNASPKDASLTQNTNVLLTDIIALSAVFENTASFALPNIPVSGFLSPRTYSEAYLGASNNIVRLVNEGNRTAVNFSPVGDGLVEIFIDGKYLQIEENYPYNAVLRETSLEEDQTVRQRFKVLVTLPTQYIVISTETREGTRYLACCLDNVLRACGVELNNTVVNDYHFVVSGSLASFIGDAMQKDIFAAYYAEIAERANNTTLAIKTEAGAQSHFLVTAPLESVVENEEARINFTRLRTHYTKTGRAKTFSNT